MAMVKKDIPVYLLAGDDSYSKEIKVNKIKEEVLGAGRPKEFNLDLLYARELTLKTLQEKLLCFPLLSEKRILIIKDISHLKQEIKDFLIAYVKKPYLQIVLILDTQKFDRKDSFINSLARYSQLLRVKEEINPTVFTLSRYIDFKKTHFAISTLNQLLEKGERPERILGGLRYVWMNNLGTNLLLKKRLKLLLECDMDIKRGRLKPVFALEKLIINLSRNPLKS
jgi:DNA polymerase III delta subunit